MMYQKARSLAALRVGLFLFFVSSTYCYSVEDWKYKELAIITRLDNVCNGSWDHGLTKEIINETRQFREQIPDEVVAFLGRRADIFERRQRGLAVYLSRFKYEDAEVLWEKLLAASENESVKKFYLVIGPTRDSGKVQLSIDGLAVEARKRQNAK